MPFRESKRPSLMQSAETQKCNNHKIYLYQTLSKERAATQRTESAVGSAHDYCKRWSCYGLARSWQYHWR